MYLLVFYFSVFINVFIFLNLCYVILKFSKKDYNISLPLIMMKKILPLISAPFFLPLFFLFMSAFDCTKQKTNLYSDELKCYTTLYYINAGLAILSIVFLLPISLITQTIFYEYSLGGEYKVLSKTTSKPEVFFLWEKIILTVTFVFLDGGEEIHIYLISILFIFSIFGIYYNFYYPRFNQNILNQIHKFFSLILFWASFVLFLGKILKKTKFNGCLALFFISVPILSLLIFFEKNDTKGKILSFIHGCSTYSEMLSVIKTFSELIDKIDNDRESNVLLEGYISLFEVNCTLKECSLKKYKKSVLEGTNGKIFLLQHVDHLYQLCLSKFPGIVEVKFAYSLYLIKKMNKREEAIELLRDIDEIEMTIEEEFIIYICNKYFHNDLSLMNENELINNELLNEIKYNQLVNDFENLINEASFMYLQFWSELLVSHTKGIENLYKMNEIVSKISKAINQINFTFEKMQKLKNKDFYIIKLYADFINDILNDKKKGEKFENLLEEIEQTKEVPIDIEFNIENINSSDVYQYIIVSAKKDTFGLISNISLSLLEIFGYTKKELIGQSLNLIIPDTFITEHDKLLKNKISSFKKTFTTQTLCVKSEPKELFTYGKNKSKYLVELNIKTTIYHNEKNEDYFIASVYKNPYKKNKENKNILNTCIILTNNQLHIQNFTVNAINLLKLNSVMINNNFEITYFIKQFHEDYLHCAIEKSELTNDKKLEIKKKIIETKYNTPQIINWRKIVNFDSKYTSSKIIEISKFDTDTPKYGTSNIYNNFNNSGIDDCFYLTVTPAKINKKKIGYFFKLEKKIMDYSKNLLSYPNKTLTLKLENNHSQKSLYQKNEAITKKDNVNLNNVITGPNEINDKFVPKNSLVFDLDYDNLAFKRVEKSNNSLNELLKQKIMKAIEDEEINNKKEKEEENEEEDDEEDEEYNEEYESSSNIEKKETKTIKNNFQNIFLQTEKTINNNEYYKVNLSKIHFLQYNYLRNVCVEVNNYEKISQVDLVFNKTKGDKDNKKLLKKPTTQKNEYFTPANKNKINKKVEENESLVEEIEYALSKEENQKSIINLAKITILIYGFLIGIGLFSMFFINSFLNDIKENSILINDSYMLIVMNSFGIYYCRELILLNNENYTEVPTRNSRDIYVQSIFQNLLDVFHKSQSYIAEIVSSTLPLSKKNKYLVSNKTFEIIMIKNNYTIFAVDSTMQGLFIETNTQLFNIATKFLEDIIPTQHDVFSYMYNALNNAGNAYDFQGEIYMDELYNKVKEIKIIVIIIFILLFFILIGIYFLIVYSYDKVNQRKESYIQVFFNINIDTIQKSLEKCERFSNKVKNMKEGIEEEIESNMSISVKSKKSNNNKTKIEINKSNESKTKSTLFHFIKVFNIKVQIFLGLIFIFFTIIFILLFRLLEQSKRNELYFQYEVLVENEFYLVFNILREFLFDRSSISSYQLSSDYLDFELQNIFTVRKKGTGIMNRNRKKIPNLYVKYSTIKKHIPCYFRRDDYFLNEKECLYFMDNCTKFGFNVMNAYYLEEIRFMKSLANSYYKNKSGYFNLTMTGTTEGNEMWPTDKSILDNFFNPIILFNHRIVKNLNIMFTNLIIPYFVELKDATLDCINDYLRNFNDTYIIMFSIFIGLITFMFFVFWIPFVKRLSSIIYNTKKMLMIIPKDVIITLPSIYTLLDINPVQNMENTEIKS